jgi:hypothetical protein
MFGASFIAALVSAIQGLFVNGIVDWITQLFSTIFPHAA